MVERSVYRHASSDEPVDNIILDPFRREQAEIAPVTTPNASTSGPSLPLNLRKWQHDEEKRLLEASLQAAKYNQKQAAELLGLTYHQLRALLKKHEIR
ncbi:Phage shock protein F [Cronobacter sakazakii]|nr:Phage shock protein F [Cronobacter sakazakii]